MVVVRANPGRVASLQPSATPTAADVVAVADVMAHRRAAVGDVQVAADVRTLLGTRLVAYVTGVTEGRAVNEWADGTRKATVAATDRMRLALQVAALIESVDGAEVAQAWFQGLDPTLGDRSPATVLRTGQPEEVGPRLLAAARTFISR